jgi:hypothetical protein
MDRSRHKHERHICPSIAAEDSPDPVSLGFIRANVGSRRLEKEQELCPDGVDAIMAPALLPMPCRNSIACT